MERNGVNEKNSDKTIDPGTDLSRGFLRWFSAHVAFLLLLWGAGVVVFVFAAESLDNDFATAARRDHKATIAKVHLVLLPSYLFVAFFHAALSWPIAARRQRRRGRASGRIRLFGSAAMWSLLIFVLSFGPVTLVSPGSLDTVAHYCAQVFPQIDVYSLRRAHVIEVFTVVVGLLALWSLVEFFRRSRRLVTRVVLVILPCALIATGVAARGHRMPDVAAVDRMTSSGRPNIIVLASDSLRYDHLSCHGYPRETSPHIDAIAREGVDFRNMFVATASTIESWASIFTGRYPANHGIRYMFVGEKQARRVSDDPNTLPRVLGRAGYHTAVVGDWAANCFTVVDFGFGRTLTSDVQNLDVFLTEVAFRSHVLVPHYFSNALGEVLVPSMSQVTTYMNPGGMIDRFLGEFSRANERGQPFFGTLFVSSTHLPYKPPYPYNVKFTDPHYRGRNRYRLAFDVDDFIQEGFADAHSPAEKQQVIDLYDGGVAHFDSMVGEIDAFLVRSGLDRNTIVVVTSDHGEDLYEKGTTLGHGTNFFGGDQANRIPFIVRMPRAEDRKATAIDDITRNIDVAPTLLELAGETVPTAEFDGVSLVPRMKGSVESLDLAAFAETCYLFFPKKVPGEEIDDTRPADKTLYIDNDFRNLFVLRPEYEEQVLATKDRMMRTPRWKLVYIKGKHGPIWRFWDMSKDPHQEHDLSSAGGAVFDRMRAALERWMESGKGTPWPHAQDE